jgi:hypothetical protein
MLALLLLWPKSQGTIATKIANVNLTKTKKTNYLQVVKIGVKVLKEIHFQLQILLDKKVVVILCSGLKTIFTSVNYSFVSSQFSTFHSSGL